MIKDYITAKERLCFKFSWKKIFIKFIKLFRGESWHSAQSNQNQYKKD